MRLFLHSFCNLHSLAEGRGKLGRDRCGCVFCRNKGFVFTSDLCPVTGYIEMENLSLFSGMKGIVRNQPALRTRSFMYLETCVSVYRASLIAISSCETEEIEHSTWSNYILGFYCFQSFWQNYLFPDSELGGINEALPLKDCSSWQKQDLFRLDWICLINYMKHPEERSHLLNGFVKKGVLICFSMWYLFQRFFRYQFLSMRRHIQISFIFQSLRFFPSYLWLL